ncbi:MAG TPA: polyprenyl diphosphate synthase [Pseudomonadales bacterium]|nr:polyprenyl diphosphate synthase [Pseudomonadales bacterium]
MVVESNSSSLKHIAVIMDGNNRWARQRGLPGVAGHKKGVERIRDVLDVCKKADVQVVTVFAFSSENWQRPAMEVNALMTLFSTYLSNEKKKMRDEGVSLRVIGDRSRFSAKLCKLIEEAEVFTAGGDRILAIAADYGGRWDIANAAKKIAEACARGDMAPADIDENLMGRTVCLGDLPPVDLLIRTGGEKRISNFLLWHVAYAELYFSDAYWPDFGAEAMQEAIADFYTRQRRFGLSGDQVGASA